jgi:integrase
MSIRKRNWTSPTGEAKSAHVVDYVDQNGKRRNKQFSRKRDAEAWRARAVHEVRSGIHTPEGASPTIKEAAELWFASREALGRERSTLMNSYRPALDKHILPFIGKARLATFTAYGACQFENEARMRGNSPAMVRKIMGVLCSLIGEAHRQGLIAHNVMRDIARSSSDARIAKRHKPKLRVGVDIPSPDEITAITAHLSGRWRPFFLTAIFTGMRASELRGLSWANVDLEKRELHVRQRADYWRTIGRPKSASSERTIPLSLMLRDVLREWELASPPNEDKLVFATKTGRPFYHVDILRGAWWPLQIRAGVVDVAGDAKYTGLHCLRHFFASWCLNRRIDGGRELPLKTVQSLLGHATIAMTADRYGHLFPRGDDAAELEAATMALLA